MRSPPIHPRNSARGFQYNCILIVIKNHDLIRLNGTPLNLRQIKQNVFGKIDAIKYGNN